ncbi:MAG: hypothetical protein A2001_01535 [Treponema sp. GWC1_61_84]|nr:MAG: hypothetical protein A2001_01535 [Treponema sp. GWC1_61_84]
MTVVPRAEVANIRIDKDQDIIPITVGLYRLFLQAGACGQEAQALYMHLIFTARLQETQQVRANNVYLSRGLGWGLARIKAAKAWLADAGLIQYVRARGEGGKLGEVYIRLAMLPRADTISARLGLATPEPIVQEEAAAEGEYCDDLTPDLFGDVDAPLRGVPENLKGLSTENLNDGKAVDIVMAEGVTTGSESDPVVTTGSVDHPVVNHAHGPERQMLNINKEMLKEKKGKEEAPASRPLIKVEIGSGDDKADASPHLEIAVEWYRRFSRETLILISPRVDDFKVSRELFDAVGGNLADLHAAIDIYFGQYRRFWFAVTKATAKKPDSDKRPDWSFRIFCSRYPEIVAAANESAEAPAAAGPAGLKFAYLFAGKDAAS